MAEFKLGRIRFIWKGAWTGTTVYYKDDIVKHGGSTFVCTTGYTSSSNFDTDFATYWDKLADGQEWKGDWTNATVYKINDIVKYGGYLYVANTAHTANTLLENDQSKWDLYAEGFDWKNTWATGTHYKVNDIAKYNGITYLCITAHTSAATDALGLEADQGNWQKFTDGLQWQSDWAINTRYRVNDVVKYGGQLYVVNTGHTSAATITLGLEADQAKFDYMHKGIEYKGTFASSTRYKANDVVKSGGGLWICVTPYTSQDRISQDEANWAQFVEGLEFEDSWNPTKNYDVGDIVTYGGYTYVAKTNHVEKRPTAEAADWDLFNTGFRFVGEWGDDSSLEDYLVGDVIRHSGFTYVCTTDHQNQEPPNATYWEKLNEGFKWKGDWTDATSYDLGDVVEYNSSSYVAVAKHTSDETVAQNRPDQDVDGSEWNLMAGGPENNVMTTDGDMVYYSGSGPARLPVGQVGQILRVNSLATAPEWGFYGAIDNVVYVDINGTDGAAPSFGTTIDRPFKTIKHAAYNIENGYLRPNARKLIQLNAAFIADETVEWVDAQVTANAGSPFTNAFTYDKAAWRVYVGRLVSALLYDLGHSGNEESRKLTLAIYNAADVTGKTAEFVATIEYAETVIDAIISNVAPAAIFGSLTRHTDVTLIEESGAQTFIGNLIDILTDAVTAGDTTGVPAESQPQNTILVKTGQFTEVGPIVVPKNTAIVGDELRSTKISPAGSLVANADVAYSLDGISRLQAVMSLAVTNPAGITKSTGNALDPIATHVVGSGAAGTAAAGIVQDIYDHIDFEINATGTKPTLAGSNAPLTSTDYTYAIESIEANREFLKAEVLAYIAVTYPLYVYDTAACARDVDRYIDAVKYDLLYTGNYKAIRAATAYVNSVSGSTLKDLFYVRNGTGLRNCTLTGLTGSLGAANAYGTKRPTAGAFVSLDPGFGTADEHAWITNKSPYVQNVTTFGTGCIGMKVDGDLHAGGNDSIVANDFTQILSDGIGVWVTNLGRSELVSVFSYYGHIGYLAENGGKIRATNGNSSYGDYGTVAEGIDSTETAITATVDNYSTEAKITNVLTDGNNILTFEYLNAGVGYTDATDALLTIENQSGTDSSRAEGTYVGVTGATSASGTGQEFDIIVDSNGFTSVVINKGGSGFVVGETVTIADSLLGSGGAANLTFDVATIGDATEFTVTGEGFGADIASVNVNDGGVFEVRLTDPSSNLGGDGFVDATNTGQTGSATQITLSNTDISLSAAYVGMAIFIKAGTGAGQYGYIDTYNSGTKIATIKKCSDDSAGWDHVTGAAIETLLNDTTEYLIEPRITFSGGGVTAYADIAKARARVSDEKIVEIRIWDSGNGYTSAPTMTVTDPNNTVEVPHLVRIGDGVLGQPTWTDRGTNFTTAQSEVTGDGYADLYQPGNVIAAEGLTAVPQAGSNVEIAGIPGTFFKLVAVRDLSGTGPYRATLQLSPEISITDAPEHSEGLQMRIRYSQVRLTGHDFLDIGTGNFANTNYPGVPLIDPDPDKETNDFNGGRVFYTSTDQDGNFRVGELFSVEQATGVATLDADAFNISGLQELQLGALSLGGTNATITEFSTDGTFTANSDNIVPTQKAIKTYIQSQIGGGAGELNVNQLTAGNIRISGDTITNTAETAINITTNVNFTGGVTGDPVALNYFLLS